MRAYTVSIIDLNTVQSSAAVEVDTAPKFKSRITAQNSTDPTGGILFVTMDLSDPFYYIVFVLTQNSKTFTCLTINYTV